MKIKAIITGSTGMVGEGVLHECLLHPDVETVLVINRRACGVQHPKLKEIIHTDFSDFNDIEGELIGYNAAFLCMGVSSIGLDEEKFNHLTYVLTMTLAGLLAKQNPQITICYVSGVGTDSSENGKTMWARVKGKTENRLLQLPIRQAYMFRPGFIRPTKGLKNAYKAYKLFNPFFPILKKVFPKYVCTLSEIGLAMINSVTGGYEKRVLEVQDIIKLSNK